MPPTPAEHHDCERAMRGDPAATEALWIAHRGFVAAVLRAHAPRAAELDDLLQEVAVAMVRHLASLRSPSALRPWLRTIALHTARSAGRRHANAAPRAAVDPDALPGRAAPTEVHDRLETVLSTVDALPVELREPLLLRAVDGLSQRAIADALGIPETTVETRLARARRLLRRDARPTRRLRPSGS